MMREIIIDNQYQVLWDERRVWVHNSQGDCIGRFDARMGIDIHNSTANQIVSSIQCLFCTHGIQSKESYNLFVEKMKEFHGLSIPSSLFLIMNVLNKGIRFYAH